MYTARIFDHKGICVDVWCEKTALECLLQVTKYIQEKGFNFDLAECENSSHVVQWSLVPKEIERV